MLERGFHVDHSTIFRWVQWYAPELDKCCRPHLKTCNDSWKVDETSIKIKKVWMYLYRAVDSEGNTLEFLLSPTRDAEAAKHFFLKALHSSPGLAPQSHPFEEQVTLLATATTSVTSAPRVINVDKNAAYPKAIAELKAAGMLPQYVELRQVKYLNNLIEQDHRFIKRLVKPGLGFFSFETAWRTLRGYEVMNMVRKGQIQGGSKGDSLRQAAFIAELFGAHSRRTTKLCSLSSSLCFCNTAIQGVFSRDTAASSMFAVSQLRFCVLSSDRTICTGKTDQLWLGH